MTLIALERIEGHLKKINGSIVSHDKIINANLPHDISHCSQSETIKEIRDKIIGDVSVEKTVKEIKADKRADKQKTLQTIATIIMAIGLLVTAGLGLWGITKQNKTINKVENLGEPVIVNSRGVTVPLPAGYEIKMWGRDTTK